MIPKTILEQCNHFLTESVENCALKNLPIKYQGFHKVKVRYKSNFDPVLINLDKAFDQQFSRKAVFAHGNHGFQWHIENDQLEPFYIFPVDGYKYLYNPKINDFDAQFKNTVDSVLEASNNQDCAENLLTDLLKYTYQSSNLEQALTTTSEIIFYDIPFYYAVRCSLVENYAQLMDNE